jgi:hypothetical protein
LSLIHDRFKFTCFVAIAQGANWYKLSNKQAVLVDVEEKVVGQKRKKMRTITFEADTF